MAHLVLGHFVAGHPGGRRLRGQRERVARAIRPARRNELFYRRQLGLIVQQLRLATEEIADELRPDWPRPRASDSASPGGFGGYMNRAAAKFGDIEAVAQRLTDVRNRLSVVRRNLAAVDESLIAAVRQAVGVDIAGALHDAGRVQGEVQRAARENVELIRSIPAQHLDRVRAAVEKAFEEGVRWESMAKDLREIGDITDRRARIIARDQTSKMNAAFNEARQAQVGIAEYTWSGALDARERDSHRRMEGQRCRWDAPPSVDGEAVHPGQAILCRCVAQPVISIIALTAAPEAQAVAA